MDVLEIFKDSPKARSLPAGEAIFRHGDAAHEMYVLLDGRVDISVEGRVVESLEPGSIFGEMAVVDDQPRSADAVAVSPVKVEPIDQEWFLHLVRKSPPFALHVMSVLAKRLRRTMRQTA